MNTQYNSSYIFSITLVATLGGLLFGYDTAVISGTVESLNTVFVAPQNLSESAANSLLGFCVASALIGCIIGGALTTVDVLLHLDRQQQRLNFLSSSGTTMASGSISTRRFKTRCGQHTDGARQTVSQRL